MKIKMYKLFLMLISLVFIVSCSCVKTPVIQRKNVVLKVNNNSQYYYRNLKGMNDEKQSI